MKVQNVDDIYSNNSAVRRDLLELLDTITPDEAAIVPDGESWAIQQIVEHIAIVDTGSAGICRKLVQGARAAGVPAGGQIAVSEAVGQKSAEVRDVKLEAPERVRPSGQLSIAEARQKLVENETAFAELRDDMAAFELKEHTFPHPYFGKLTAADWLMIAGGHERRHIEQIKRVLEQIRK